MIYSAKIIPTNVRKTCFKACFVKKQATLARDLLGTQKINNLNQSMVLSEFLLIKRICHNPAKLSPHVLLIKFLQIHH